MSRRRIATLTAALALASAWVAPGAARAESMKIGSALQEPYEFSCCGAGVLGVQRALGGNPLHPLESPVNGRITSWSVRSGDAGALYSLRVLTLVGGFTYFAYATAPAPTAIPASTDTIYSYPASVEIGQGETIGLQAAGGKFLPANLIASTTDTFAVGPPIPDGSTGSLASTYPVELLMQATVEFCRVPKLKGVSAKKAKKRLSAAGCGVKVKERKASGRRRGKVVGQKPAKGDTVPPGTPVRIFVGS